jgi:hypothetical protein
LRRRRDILNKRKTWLETQHHSLDDCKQLLCPETTQILRDRLKELQDLRLRRRFEIIDVLRHIFPIVLVGVPTIRTVMLPNCTFAGYDEDQIATGLGYAAHLVLLLSQYTSISLRYPLKAIGSRSLICDPITRFPSGDSNMYVTFSVRDTFCNFSISFPLYARHADRQRFEYGVFLLNKNIEQV